MNNIISKLMFHMNIILKLHYMIHMECLEMVFFFFIRLMRRKCNIEPCDIVDKYSPKNHAYSIIPVCFQQYQVAKFPIDSKLKVATIDCICKYIETIN